MVAKKKRSNPFYFLLVLVGISFTLTACAYGVMTVRGIRPDISVQTTESGEGLMKFLDKQGFSLLMWQLGILAFLTLAAMLADLYWANGENNADNESAKSKTSSAGDKTTKTTD